MKRKPATPWQRVFKAFEVKSQTDFARMMGKDRSKICRVLADKDGLINGRDQKKILELARAHGVHLTPNDLLPEEMLYNG